MKIYMFECNKVTKNDKIAKQIFDIDRKFYGDNFFSLADIKKMVSGKSKHKIYVDQGKFNETNNISAYIILFKMPSGATYITSLAGAKKARRLLLSETIKKVRGRLYTHGLEKWGMDLFREFGFKNKGRGNLADEEVPFGDDITRLTVYELYKS